jgi:uncharacterized protein
LSVSTARERPAPGQSGGLVDTARSPHARLQPVPLGSVRLLDGFWAPRREVNRGQTLPSQYDRCEETGRLDNFRRAAGKIGGTFRGRYYNDSDVYKWAEAAALCLAEGGDPTLERMLSNVVREIADAQEPDGYLNTYFTFERRDERWTNLKDLHELYCDGHLIQAAVAHRRGTGETTLLETARRLADHICAVFGPGQREGTCGHQEIEMALVELYRETAEPCYLDQARLFIERRGQQPPAIGGSPYHQDHLPFRELDAVTGHAVRMLYYCCGAADVVAETGEPAYREALDRLWRNMVTRRLYVTGGAGARWDGEAFGDDFELPDRAYAESCAAIASVMWNWRMLQLEGEARFADLLETTLYNAVLPGLSLDGEHYFYQNPLADPGSHRRRPWFDCACCPPNIARLLAALPAYFYSCSEEGLWVHLYAAGTVACNLGAGRRICLRQKTDYPWSGRIDFWFEEIETHGAREGEEFTLYLRVPAWCRGATCAVNDGPTTAAEAGYVPLRRRWRPGDRVTLNLPMAPERLSAHPYIVNTQGRVALRRGPLIYCLEQADHPGHDPRDLVLPTGAPLTTKWEPDLLGGVVTLQAPARIEVPCEAWRDHLYLADPDAPAQAAEGAVLRAIPYYAWANRSPGPMLVWVRSE